MDGTRLAEDFWDGFATLLEHSLGSGVDIICQLQ